MRLEQLDLTRYGRFTDTRLDFPAPAAGVPDLHVIFGPNEAGKSTLFSAWLDLLYGIPLRSRYDFLHPGPTMQIGARLSHTGGSLSVVRVKRNGQSLQNGTGQPLPEAVMQAALAGLGREGYQAMFSLDDDTLEQGGDSILASRGDLGEMLFSASAGLAGLGPQLEAMRKDLDAFHKPRGRSTLLKQAKERLQDLDRQRRDLDTSATAAQKLQRDAVAAEKAWVAARQAETDTDAALKAVAGALALVPQQARLARLRDEIAGSAGLPEVGAAEERALQDIDQALHGLAGQMVTRAGAMAELDRRLGALPRDPAILPLADRIAGAAGLYPLHQAALADLPRRCDSLAAVAADLGRRMQALGLSGDAKDHAMTPALLARLRALILQRDVARQALMLAQEEVSRAAARLARLREAGSPDEGADLQSLGHLVARLRQAEPATQMARAGQECGAADGDLARALLALAPWRGAPRDLLALSLPAPWQIAAWEAADQATGRVLRDAVETLARRRADLAVAERAGGPDAGGAPGLTEAAEARRLREARWAAHLTRLTPETAAEFEVALRLDDGISLRLAEAMVAERQAVEGAARLARLTAQAAEAEAALQAAQTERQALERAVADCAAELGLWGAGLADLKAWLVLRDKALLVMTVADQALAARQQAEAALAQATADLAAGLNLPASTGFSRLLAEAMARLDTAALQREVARQLADLQADLAERRASLDAAGQALMLWRQAWQEACSGTVLSHLPDDDAGLAAVLDDLDSLSRKVAERAELADRISKMEGNSRSFLDAAGAIGAALGDSTGWAGFQERLAAAQQAERDQAGLAADLARDRAAQAADQAQVDALSGARLALGARLGWDGAGNLAEHLAACLRAGRLRRDIAELEAELSGLGPVDQETPVLEAEAVRLQTALTLARSEAEARFADLAAARRAVQAVGDDDAVARIAAERANLLNALQDQARAHLAQRFGLMAFEQGLRRYRDSHRSAMLARASEAFSRLSRGAYAGLAAQPEGGTEVLVALPAVGGSKLATDLSKGTRFQLYLALRIAGYHELALSRPPVPFVADDIMETFDDERAAQAFSLLGDMSRRGQVIYLTHHQHLCEIAQNACPGARIVDLRAV